MSAPKNDNGAHDWTVSMVRAAHITETTEASFREVMDEIAGPRWKGAVEAVRQAYATGGKDAASEPKKKLPAVLFSGTFSRRAASALTISSGIICVDLDELGDRVEQVRDLIVSDPHTLGAFISPTGTGLKVIFRVDPAKPHLESFKAAERFVLEHFGLEVDQACKDVSRMCFVSHDPQCFAANDAEILPYPAVQPVEFKPSGLHTGTVGELTPGDDYDLRGDFKEVLLAHGWTKLGEHGWTRPGKTTGVSATFDKVPGRFYVFSSSTEFETNHTYRPWHIFALLECGGDFTKAARELGAKGYGEQKQRKGPRILDEEGNEVMAKAELELVARPITSYAYPSDDDPNILLGSDDYLGRGGGLLFVSHAGAGKSSWAMDACMMWALGRAWMQIKAHIPRKILIIQAEDSDRYIGKIFTSFAHVNKLTAEDLALLTKNCIIIRLKGVSGLAFFAALKKLTDQHQPDLVIINPLYLYADGDITRSEFAQPFLLALDAINKAEKWGYILIHHTGKPAARDKSGKRAEIEDWESAYMGFGSSYLANWPRATILLEPVPGTQGRYQIKLGKGGLNAGVTKEVEQGAGFRLEPHTRISIRHSREKMPIDGKDRPVYYWEIDDEAPPEEAKGKGGRPSKYKIAEYLRFIPLTRALADTAPRLFRAMNGVTGIPPSSWADLLFRAANDGEIILTEVDGKGPCYHRKKGE